MKKFFLEEIRKIILTVGFLQLIHFFVEVAALQIQDAVVEGVNGSRFGLVPNPPIKFFHAGNSAADYKVVLALELFCADLFSLNVLKSDCLRYFFHHCNFLADRIHQVEFGFRKENGQWDAREASAGADVENFGIFLKAHHLRDAE